MMRKFAANFCLVLSAVCLLAAGWAVWSNLQEEQEAEAFSEEIIFELQTLPDESAPESSPDISRPAEDAVMTTDTGAYIGTLEIPKLNIRLPVCSELSYPALRQSPCRYVGQVVTDDAIIAAHNYKRHFGGLHRLEPGDAVMFYDANDQVILYQVSELSEISGQDLDGLLDRDAFDLTLFTCKLNHKDRIVVRCNRI